MNSKVAGNKTEARILAALVEQYPAVLVPFGDNEKYDFVFEDYDKSFKRVQCKTGRYRNGAVIFNTYSTTRINGKHTTTAYALDEVDYFGVSCPDFNDVWLLPVGSVTLGSQVSLRVDPYSTEREYKCTWAKDFLLYSPCK